MENADIPIEIKQRLNQYSQQNNMKPASTADGEKYGRLVETQDVLYFTYGSLKKGFPNFDDHADILNNFIGEAKTRQSFPLVVPFEPSCTNPHCPYLHRMAALLDIRGKGHRIRGELYRIKSDDLQKLDKLEGYVGPNMDENIYLRKKITVLLDNDICEAYTYFIADTETHLDFLKQGTAEMINNYSLDMAKGELKPGWEEPSK